MAFWDYFMSEREREVETFDGRTRIVKTRAPRIGRIVGTAAAALGILIIVFGSWYVVPAGHQAVEFSAVSGVKEGTTGPGMHFKIPLAEQVTLYKVQKQLYTADAAAASKDGQEVHSQVGVGFHPDAAWVNWLHQNIGPNYADVIIVPAVQEAVKAATAQHDALNLIRNRTVVNQEIRTILEARLIANHIFMDELSITEFDYSDQFNHALEQKVVAEQNALAAQNKLKQVEYEAQQKIAEATGQAEAARLLSEQLSKDPAYLQFLWLQRWNGELPQYMGGESSASILLPFNQVPTT